MAKPRLIILIRHAQSEGNKNRDIHQSVPDHRVMLTPEGWNQAYDAGRRLRQLLHPDDKIHFFTSPYRRTRDTTQGILATLTSDEEEISPFRRSAIKVYEEPRLREQDFGNFQPCSAEMERMWQERADYGHFFYRIPNGESAADAYDRVSGFNESLWRQFSEEDFASVCVLVTHGLMSRVFLMKWYHFDVEYFEDLRNVDHCEFLIMRQQDNGRYNLETKLRTWSELKRERIASLNEKDKDKNGKDREKDHAQQDLVKLQRSRTYVATRRWGGCPNGCNHTYKYSKRHELESLRQSDVEQSATASSTRSVSAHHRHCTHRAASSDGDGDDDNDNDDVDDDRDSETLSNKHNHNHICSHAHSGSTPLEPNRPVGQAIRSTPADALDDTVAELPDRKSSSASSHSLHLGRDFGGSYSGHASAVDSDSDKIEEDDDDHDHDHSSEVNYNDDRGHGVGGLHNKRRRRGSRGSILNSIEARLLQSTVDKHQGRQHSVSSSAGTSTSTSTSTSTNTGTRSSSGRKALSSGNGSFVNRLGDAPSLMVDSEKTDPDCGKKKKKKERGDHGGDGCNGEAEGVADGDEIMHDLVAAEAADRSIQGSVY